MIAEIGGIISLNIVRLQVCVCLGTIHILRQHNFGPFSDPPAHSGPTRQARFGPCLHFGFQYALIRNNWSKICWVEYWTLPGSNSLWRPCHYVSINTVLNFTKSGHFLNPPTKSFWWRNIWMVSYVIRREIECVMLHIMLSSAGLWDFKNKRTRGELDVDILFTWHFQRQISLGRMQWIFANLLLLTNLFFWQSFTW